MSEMALSVGSLARAHQAAEEFAQVPVAEMIRSLLSIRFAHVDVRPHSLTIPWPSPSRQTGYSS